MAGDVPLKEAQLIWDYRDTGSDRPPARVVRLGGKDEPDYIASWGACNGDFVNADDATKLLMLFRQFHAMVVDGDVEAAALHQALLVIPEYRTAIYPYLLPERYQEEG
jgi:hypothetical protein